eukprot:6202667-Pleurochrysis_carterae.AAC.2
MRPVVPARTSSFRATSTRRRKCMARLRLASGATAHTRTSSCRRMSPRCGVQSVARAAASLAALVRATARGAYTD